MDVFGGFGSVFTGETDDEFDIVSGADAARGGDVGNLKLGAFVDGRDVDDEIFQFEGVEAAGESIGERHGDAHRGDGGNADVAAVDIVEADAAGVEIDAAADRVGGGADAALGGIDRGENGHLRQQGGHDSILNHGHLIFVLGDIDLNRDHGGAAAHDSRDGGVAVLGDGAHPFARGGDFKGRGKIREQGEHFGAGEGEFGGSGGKKSVAEGVDTAAVDGGNGSIGSDAEVASHQLDADHGAGLEAAGVAELIGRIAAAGDALEGIHAEFFQFRAEMAEGGGGESGKRNRGGEFFESRIACLKRLGPGGAGFRIGIDAEHFFDWTDAGDGLGGHREAEGNGSGELSVDVYGRSAHALHDSGFGERSTGEAGEDDGLLGSDVFEDAEDFDLKFFYFGSGEDGASDAALSGFNVLERKDRGCCLKSGRDEGDGGQA